jgi:hypothetical protein
MPATDPHDDEFPTAPAYRRRSRPSRRSSWMSLLAILSPAPIAAWIVFSNDLPRKIHAWLRESPATESRSPVQSPAGAAAPRVKRPGQSEPSTLPTARPADRIASAPPQRPAGNTNSDDRESGKPGALAPPPSKIAADHEIKLELTGPKQFHRLDDVDGVRFRVLGLEGCSVPYSIDPENAVLDERQRTAITIEGPRRVTLELSIRARDGSERAILVQPTVVTDDGDTIPFTVKVLETYRRRVVKSREAAVAQLAAMEAERDQLHAFIHARVTKPLAARGEARLRVAQLETDIPICRQTIASLELDRQVAEQMLAFAEQLRNECHIQLSGSRGESGG